MTAAVDDLRRLWASVHSYLLAQGVTAPPNVEELSAAYQQLVDCHNEIHERYIAGDEQPPTLRGVA